MKKNITDAFTSAGEGSPARIDLSLKKETLAYLSDADLALLEGVAGGTGDCGGSCTCTLSCSAGFSKPPVV